MERVSGKELERIVEDGLVVVDFYADWCAPCRFLKPILERVEKDYSGVRFVKVNVDDDPEVAYRYGVASIPTVLIFHKGRVVGGFVGAMPENAVREQIDRAIRRALH